MNTNRKAKLAALAIIPTLAVGALAGSVFAASTTASGTPSSVFRPSEGHGPRDTTQFATDLASILGLSATDIKAKLDAGETPDSIITASGKTKADVEAQMKTLREANMKTRLAADVASGKITQAQADQMITDMANGTFNHFGGPGKNHGAKDSARFASDLASILGLSATDVKAKLDAGTKPAEIITAAGKTESDVQTAMKALHEAEMKTRLAADVASGKLTQAQADAIIAHEATETHDGYRGGPFGEKSGTTSAQ